MAKLFACTVFVAAALLFVLEPLTGRLVLPKAGGTPTVWTTCLLVYQALMLAGYAYADALSRIAPRGQCLVHGVVLLVPLVALPVALPADTAIDVSRPVMHLLPVLFQTIGLPFLALATTAPLMQRWFAIVEPGRDPYPLYAASNAGSLLGLAAYPFAIEPMLGVREQGRWWAAGYGVFVLLCFACGGRLLRARALVPTVKSVTEASPMPWLRWLLLSLAPSSLLMASTAAVTTDITPVPLLWVAPLALYLITFILAFAGRRIIPHKLALSAAPIAALAVAYVLFTNSTTPWWAILTIHLAGLFCVALACHGELALLKPPPARLTRFYLIMSLGGLLGGVFNALIAPAVLARIGLAEYPLMLALAIGLLPPRPVPVRPVGRMLVYPIALAGAAGLGLWIARTFISPYGGIVIGGTPYPLPSDLLGGLLFGVPLVLLYLVVARPWRFAVGLVGLWAASLLYVGSSGPNLYYERNFFGPVKVAREFVDGSHILVHGSTLHGRQMWKDERGINEPLSYYGRPGPIGDVMRLLDNNPDAEVAVCGLGAGSMAAFARPGQRWTFYEIDPAIATIAQDPRYFSYLSDNFPGGRGLTVALGDARLELAKAADGKFRVIVLDAFSSDSIPVHLLTREAIELYRAKLAPGGVIAFHISNRYLNLKPVLASAARDLGMVARIRADEIDPAVAAQTGRMSSIWVVLARTEGDLGQLAGRWDRLAEYRKGFRTWTDDYSNLLSVFQFDSE